jgi:hypothetical protein
MDRLKGRLIGKVQSFCKAEAAWRQGRRRSLGLDEISVYAWPKGISGPLNIGPREDASAGRRAAGV